MLRKEQYANLLSGIRQHITDDIGLVFSDTPPECGDPNSFCVAPVLITTKQPSRSIHDLLSGDVSFLLCLFRAFDILERKLVLLKLEVEACVEEGLVASCFFHLVDAGSLEEYLAKLFLEVPFRFTST